VHPIPTQDRAPAPASNRTRASVRIRLALIALVGLAAAGVSAQDAPADPPANPPAEVPMDWGNEPAPRPERPARRAGEEPAGQPAADPASEPEPEPEPTVSFGIFSEPVQLSTLVDFVGQTLGINIVVKGAPTGEIVFNAPVSVPRSKLLDLLDAMLEQYGFTIVSEPTTGFYIVQPVADVRPSVGGSRASVRIIPTPNIKPSQLVVPLTTVLGASGSTGASVQAVDELGVVIVTAPSRDIARVEALVEELRRVDAQQQYIRLELAHIAAPVALERAIGLVGGGAPNASGIGALQQQFQRGQRGDQGTPTPAAVGGSFSNLADRITVDPQGNALIFRGTPDEITRVRSVMAQIDVPNTLQPRSFYAGSSATQIAQMAQNRGLGQVIEVDTTAQSGEFNQFQFFAQQQRLASGQQQTNTATQGGPVMVVDAAKGNIIYYGTPEQHKQMENLMRELRTDDERVVIRSYVLNHSDAETVADLITGLITGQRQTGDAPLLPTNRGTNTRTGTQTRIFNPADPGGSGDEVSASFDPDVVVVIPNIENNQVVVQAPLRQQDEIAKLIERLDRRRAQVYLQAVIVSVSDDENFTLAFESQYLRGEFGIGTNFGLSGTGGDFTDPSAVNPSLAGLTAAIIKSDYVPLIINASQTNTDSRILSMPQLLVNDNEESEIVSLSEEPFSEITNTDGNDPLQGFGGFAEAGTTLRVTPSISDGGFLRLSYFVELSNFTEAGGSNGNPPPRDRNTVSGAVTIPSDSTIVIGGITVDNVRNTVAKVPFLGDIPLVGELFKRTNKINTKARLYVFLTPRIMTDPNFNDLKLLTQGPQADMAIDQNAPDLQAEAIRSSLPNRSGAPELAPAAID
jgi:type II secretory pathway component GspD/PulD (secretin)